MAAALQPFAIVRESAAGLAGGAAFWLCHYVLVMPSWQLPGVAIVLQLTLAVLVYAGVRCAWADRPGLIERWLGKPLPLRSAVTGNDPDSLRQALQFTVAAARPQLGEPVRRELDRVVDAVEAVLAVWVDSEASREAAYSLHATVKRYLPDTLENYLKLPRKYATQRPIRDGKTACDLVLEQLRVLADSLLAIADKVNQGNAADLAAHGRFLEQRFNRADSLLDQT